MMFWIVASATRPQSSRPICQHTARIAWRHVGTGAGVWCGDTPGLEAWGLIVSLRATLFGRTVKISVLKLHSTTRVCLTQSRMALGWMNSNADTPPVSSRTTQWSWRP